MSFRIRMGRPRRRGAVAMAVMASLTIVTGVAAQQAPATVTLFPESDIAFTGSCAEYTVTVRDQNGQPVQGVTVDVSQGKRDPMLEPHATTELAFCDPAPGHTRNPTGQGGTAMRDVSGNNPSQTPGEFGRNSSVRGEAGPTDANGDVTFGITMGPDLSSGTVFVTVWVDFDEDDLTDLEEPSDATTHRWVHADRVPPVIDAGPEIATHPNGSQHVVTVVVKTSEGEPVQSFTPRSVILPDAAGQPAGDVADPAAGPSPNATVRGAPPWAYSCTPTNGQGISTCTFQDPASTAAGTDTVVFFWDQGGEARWPDGPDPQDAVQVTWGAAATPSPTPTPPATPTPSPGPSSSPAPSPSPTPTPSPSPAAARYIRLCQTGSASPCDTSAHTRDPGDVHEVAAFVSDRNGRPVANVPVEIRQSGPARFTATGTATVVVKTGNDGVARAVMTSEIDGTSTVVAEVSPPGSAGSFRGFGATDDECEQPTGPGGTPPAGNCVSQTLAVHWAGPVNGHECADGIDNDGDGLVDYPQDPSCDDAGDVEEPYDFVEKPPAKHPRTISMHFRDVQGGPPGRLAVSGRVRLADPADDYRRCTRNMDVHIQRLVGGEWVTKGRDWTNRRGRYSVDVRDVPGRYRAVAIRVRFEGDRAIHTCKRAAKEKTHHHRG